MRATKLLFRGQRQRGARKVAEALDALGRAAQTAPDSPHVRLHHALALADGGRLDEALRSLHQASEGWPRNPVFPLFRALLLIENGRVDEAEGPLEAARGLSPTNLLGHAVAALIRLRRGDIEGALRSLGVVGLTDNARALAAILAEVEAALFGQFGTDSDASSPNPDVVPQPDERLRRRDAKRLAANGLARLEKGDALGAWALLAVAAEKNPSLPDVLTHLGCACFDLGRYEEAVEHLSRVGEWSKSLQVSHLHRGAALYKLGRFDEALAALEAAGTADELGDYATWIHFYLGRTLIALGREADARGHFRSFIELEGDLAVARLRQARQLLGLEVPESAPKGFVVREKGRAVLVVKPAYEQAVRERQPPGDGGAAKQGRAPIERIALPDGVGLLRQYRRGGILGGLLGSIHLDGRRFLHEIGVADALRRRGVPTPEVLAGCRHEVAPGFYRMAVVTREEPGACDLAAALRSLPGGPEDEGRKGRLLTAVARLVRQVHDAGLHHRDLNARNVLIAGDGSALVLDLDRADLLDELSSGQRVAAIARLYRSLHKLGLAPQPVSDDDWRRFYAAYAGEDRALGDLAGRVLQRCRRDVRRHRLWWRLTGQAP